jgi:membrane-associated protease RseP (regulator of RpoE activity)
MTVVALLVAVLILAATIALHEFGHLIAARGLGVEVESYSIGFGPLLYARKARGVSWQVRALPLGGYVRTPGLDGAPPWRQAAVCLAGPGIQFLAAWVVMALRGHPLRALQLLGQIIGNSFQGLAAVPVAAWHIITWTPRTDGLSGPVGVIQQGAQHVDGLPAGPLVLTAAGALAYFVVLNVAIGAVNLIPVPPLDGGGVLLAGLRWARVPERVRAGIQVGGILAFLGLFVVIILGDVVRALS